MSRGLVNTFIFLAGAAVGAGIAVYLTKETYRQLAEDRADEEIQSVINAWERKNADRPRKEDPTPDDIDEFVEEEPVLKKERGVRVERSNKREDYSAVTRVEPESKYVEEPVKLTLPYVISPTEYGEEDNYTKRSLTFFADDVLLDPETNKCLDAVDVLGSEEPLNSFGVYEQDTVYVRDPDLEVDYEILATDETYEDFVNNKPRGRR